ncbi:kallikrein-7-like [Myotis daubentonii]|uniref:kallikrein-7-like n=1 Tax=Myotis daubentonii TaxID=98922 RepID=UPI002873D9C0|nr:kallikrein-7-like [Myotis daubentonii]
MRPFLCVAATAAQTGHMAGPLLLLLLSFALGSAGQAAHGNGERIVNGAPCSRGSHPWQVALMRGRDTQCTGVLIHAQWVLTVGHCRQLAYNVQMGSDVLNDPNAQVIRATESFVYPQFDGTKKVHDIMLVKLSRPATLSSSVRTLAISPKCTSPGTTCLVSGWGSTTGSPFETYPSDLMCTNVTIIRLEDCRRHFLYLKRHYMVCGGTHTSNTNAYVGDSGGPLVCNGALRGLVSRGPSTPSLNPVVFTAICRYTQWIEDTMRRYS